MYFLSIKILPNAALRRFPDRNPPWFRWECIPLEEKMNEIVEGWMNGGINREMNKATGIKFITFIPNLVTVAGLKSTVQVPWPLALNIPWWLMGGKMGASSSSVMRMKAVKRSGFLWRQWGIFTKSDLTRCFMVRWTSLYSSFCLSTGGECGL